MFLSKSELYRLGLKSFGENVLISDKASIISPNTIEIGHDVRIDDFCILSGDIKIGSNIHIGCYSHFLGHGKIELSDYSQFSTRCSIFSSTDDFSGKYLAGPMVAEDMRNVRSESVIFEKFTLLGCGTVVMPGVTMGEGSATGANAFVKDSLMPWKLYAGSPAKFIKDRDKPFFFFGTYGGWSA